MKDMVSKSHAKRRKDIKTKLMAAVAMLLVSSIMMVSTTYAWFTLSTAPEVTGITTSVGANGNLEMALMPLDGLKTTEPDFGITSSVGDSLEDDTVKNTTWGNLVDLSNSSFYGLDKITLYPSQLNVDDTGALAEAMLKTPTYGADGRVSDVVPNTVTSAYDGTGSFANGPVTIGEETVDLSNAYGVRAVGTASGMTDRQLAFRNAKAAANSATSKAKNDSTNSLNANGQVLGNIVIKKATGDDNTTYTKAELTSILGITEDLLGKDNKVGIITSIEKAYINYIIAYAASTQSPLSDSTFNAFEGWIAEKTPYAVIDELATGVIIGEETVTVTLPTEISNAIGELETTKITVSNAQTGLTTLISGKEDDYAYKWVDFSEILLLLANVDEITVNDIAANDVKENLGTIVSAVSNGQGINVKMTTGGGVYADIADHCGDYTASVTLKDVTYGGFTTDLKANMTAHTMVTSPYLAVLKTLTDGYEAPAAGDEGNPITDMYGYVIDLAFRTNAAGSNLLLQTDAIDRIYSDNNDETLETMGKGSSMTFTAENGFDATHMAGLMENIRIVFFETKERTVLKYARLDMTDYVVEGGNTITVPIKLWENDAFVDGDDKPVITALTQNTAQAVSVLVYLDGASITNADVAATGSKSMTGTMNIQFASDATLTPMVYTPLTEQGEEITPAATEYNVTLTGADGGEKATAGTDYTFTLEDDSYTNITVTIGGQPYTGFTESEGTYTIPGSAITGDIVITAAAPAGG